jgi:antitoxin HicB
MSEAAIRLHVEPLEEGGYVGTSPDVPGLVVEGRNLVEVVELAQQLTRTIVETYLEHGDPLPSTLAALDIAGPIDLMIPVGIR